MAGSLSVYSGWTAVDRFRDVSKHDCVLSSVCRMGVRLTTTSSGDGAAREMPVGESTMIVGFYYSEQQRVSKGVERRK